VETRENASLISSKYIADGKQRPKVVWLSMIGFNRYGTDGTGVPVANWMRGDTFLVSEGEAGIGLGVFDSRTRNFQSAKTVQQTFGFLEDLAHGSIVHDPRQLKFIKPFAVEDCEFILREVFVQVPDFLQRYGQYCITGPQGESMGILTRWCALTN